VILHNFKSFRHANIRFGEGFNCIVGPNGSGKSNICDSLLFALGESSLKRMRLTSFPQIINSYAKPKKEDNVKRAYVKLTFSGEEPVEISRIIKSNNKVGYRLNGRHVTRQDVIDVLRAGRCEINETNTITQGEIGTLLSLNARERRELIDVAAGIKEFDDKKDASLKELEKVEGKINEAGIMVNERQGFLDELEKEKEDAERYLALADSIKNANYTILKTREGGIASEYEKEIALIKGKEQKRAELDNSIKETDMQIEKLSSQKAGITKSLNERSIEVGSTSKLLESANKDIAVKESQRNLAQEKISDLKKNIEELKSARSKMLEERSVNERAIDSAKVELEEKAKKLKQAEAYEDAGSVSLLGKYEENQKELDGFVSEYNSASDIYMKQSFAADSLGIRVKELKAGIDGMAKEYGGKAKVLEVEREGLQAAGRSAAEAQKRLEKCRAEEAECKTAIDRIYSDSVNIREQLASSGHTSDRSAEILGKSIRDGFYGRAYELCSYDEKYATAVQAAAGQRLNYFVVDSSETASSAIRLLKEKNLGRASFIPVKEMQVRQGSAAKGLEPLIEHVKFDNKHENAFMYIFSNTYLVGSIEAARKAGVGSCRFVTLEGELVEQSGIITGGPMRVMQSPVALESKLRGLEEEKKAANARLSELNAASETIRKSIASSQTEEINHNMEIKYLQEQAEKLGIALKDNNRELVQMEAQLSQAQAEMESLKVKREKLASSIAAIKGENEKLYSINRESQTRKGKQHAGAEVNEAKALRDEAERIKISIATAAKESEMLGSRAAEMEKEAIEKEKEMKELRAGLSNLEKDILEVGKTRGELQERIKSHDAKSASLYKDVQELEKKLESASTERGRLSSEKDKAERDLIEMGSRKTQLETRMNDIKAELLSYTEAKMLEFKGIEQLESRLAVAKSDIERLGAVNLKAPEIYESKRQDVESAKQKLQTLDSEKSSVIAMINEIESKKLNIFVDTLKAVNDNFKSLYGNIFEGSAYLYLENPKDPFNSGLLFHMTSAANRERQSEQLSGGEKSLLMIMLIFAIQMRNPMSFYIFDEIDASLDKENSKKLSKLMKELSRSSQVIMVSHNDSLITAADTAIGVVRKNDESQAIGMQLTANEIKSK
jgi:chromosome segregation protein